jgi:cyclase
VRFVNVRVIPRMDIKGPNLVKGIHLEGLRVLGKPEDFAAKYCAEGADEIIYMDIVASLYGRANLLGVVSRAAETLFIPLTAGGGVRSIGDIAALLRAGADKVAINTAAIANPLLITEGARMFGSQCIVVSIEAKSRGDGRYEAFTDNAREATGKEVFGWAREAVRLGAGELLVTSIDRDGTGTGYDLDLLGEITSSVRVPVIASGGAGKADDLVMAATTHSADALSAASIFHYHYLDEAESAERYTDEGNTEFLRRQRGALSFYRKRITPTSVAEVRQALRDAGVECRA